MPIYRFLFLVSLFFPIFFQAQSIHELKINSRIFPPYNDYGIHYEWINKERKSWTISLRSYEQGAETTSRERPLFEERYLQISLGKRFYLIKERPNTAWFINPFIQSQFRITEDEEYLNELKLRYGSEFTRKYTNGNLGALVGYKKLFRNNLFLDIGFSNALVFQYNNASLFDRPRNLFQISSEIDMFFLLGYRF